MGIRRFIVGVAMVLSAVYAMGQIRTDKVMLMGRNALYYEDYVLAIQRFNAVIAAKPYLHEAYFYRGLAKFYLEDFAGADFDVTTALGRSPYNAQYYQLRALCRINEERFQDAINDYRKSLSQNPIDKNSWHNMVICHLQLDEYDKADLALDSMLHLWSNDVDQMTLKADVCMLKKDTVKAEDWIDKALAIDPYHANALTMKAMLYLSRDSFARGEEYLDRAILQKPRGVQLFVNRALARYNQNNLRGAMSDYDQALEIDDNCFTAHYNRALLRAQVGADNLAIEDFNYVLKVDPEDMIALYNRAILLDHTGDYRGAIRDISAVINHYPQFWDGYRYRAAIRRKIGDTYGAERDEFKVFKAEMEVRTGTYRAHKVTRKKNDKNIEDYNKLIVDEDENKSMYANEFRGKVQNRKAELKMLPDYVVAFYRTQNETNRYIPYGKIVESLNQHQATEQKLYLCHVEEKIDTALIKLHLERLVSQADANNLLQKVMDYYTVREFTNAIDVLDSMILSAKNEQDPFIYFLRSQMLVARVNAQQSTMSNDEQRMSLQKAQLDLNMVLSISPDFVYAVYNRANIMMRLGYRPAAIDLYTKAIDLDNRMPEAYFNRAVAYIEEKQIEKALPDLSQAGELGLYQSYNLIKKYTGEQKAAEKAKADKNNAKTKTKTKTKTKKKK